MMAWVAAAQVGASALSSLFGGRSARKAQKAAQKRDFASEKYFTDLARQDALKDQRYREEAIGAYRPFQSGGLMSPEYTDPNSITPVDPYTKKPK
jgi:hypothetical protein